MKTNAELRKELVSEMRSKKPNQQKIADLEATIDAMDAEVASRDTKIFIGDYGAPEPMEDCNAGRN